MSDSTLLIRGRHVFSELLEKFSPCCETAGNFLHIAKLKYNQYKWSLAID